MDALQTELERRWRCMFVALTSGDEVPPAMRLRTEGMMEAAVLLECAAPAGLQRAMDDCYRAACGQGIAEQFGDDWQDFFPFPQIPAMGRRAPVYPSTSD
jgi:hypothetical protein